MAQSQSSSNSDNSDKSPPSSSHDNNNNNDNNNNHNDNNGNNGNNNNNNANNHNDNNGDNGNNNNNNNNNGNNGNNNGNNGQNNGNNGQNNGSNGNNNGQNNGNNGNNNGNNGNNQNNGNNNNRNNNNGNNNNGNNHNDNNGNNNNNGNNGNNNNNNNNGNNNNGGNNNDEVNRNNNYWNDKNNNKNNKSPPPPAVSTDSTPSKPSSSSSTTLAGILAGVGVLIVLLVVLIVWLLRRRKMKRQKEYHEAVQYHSNSPKANLPTAQSPYNPNWYNGSHQSEAPSSGAMSQASGWPMPPPAPMMTGEVSGAFSSGPVGPLQPPPHPSVALGFNKSSFTYEELAGATQGFSQGNLLGQGGFGFVHKGILPNGKEIAVKSLKSGSGQGEREFQAEVEIISRVHHRHLVSLVGYCINGGQRMLVYEFVPNNTLEFHLHGKGQPIMDFPSRHKIALGSAKGLSYLHEDCHPRIIHRDIKTANILLDHTFEAKVADFGLAKLSSDNFSHVSTRVMGTFGYLAPEYAASGKLTEKSDVFSYGVVLLELITGRRPVSSSSEEDSLVDWARPQLARVLEEGTFEGVVDPRLENNFNQQELTRMVACAAASIRHSAKKRPKMSQICRALEGDMSLEALNEGGKQGHSGYNSGSYQQDSRTYDSGEYTSSGYGTSSEYAPTGSRDIV